jgi:thiopurine S-methyltransferase
MEHTLTAQYWEERYLHGYTGWDIGHVSGGMKQIIDQLPDKTEKILVPGAGNGFEVAYLWQQGFTNVFLLDWAQSPLDNFAKKNPDFPKDHLLRQDFFMLDIKFNLVLEQTFFCALHPSQRNDYVQKMHEILLPDGRIQGLLFSVPMYDNRPPYGGSIGEYQNLFSPLFEVKKMQPCTFSEPDRMGMEAEIELVRI